MVGKKVNNEILLAVVILSLLEDDNMHVHDVLKLVKKTTVDVWHGLADEQNEKRAEEKK